MLSTIVFITVFCFLNSGTAKDMTAEICLWEAFKPECSSNEVVFVEDAKYGRMRIGKCLSQSEIDSFGPQSMDHKVLGCYHDVTAVVSRNCSLERQCELRLGVLEQLKNTKCAPGLKMHLEVKYSCLPVLDQFTTDCQIFLTGTPKYLSITPRSNILCGTDANPLLVEVSKGQRISLTVKPLKESETLERRECQKQIGTIIDGKRQDNATICDNGIYNPSKRSYVTNGYISKENHIGVIFNRYENSYKVLVEMKADGCLDIIPPEDTWLKRTNDDIVIGCYSSKQTWYLRCENGHWTGVIGNCSNPDSFFTRKGNYYENNEDITNLKLNMSQSHQTLIIISICGFGLVTCLAIVCLGFVYLKKMKIKEAKKDGCMMGPNLYGNSTYGHVNRYPDSNSLNGQTLFSSTFNKLPRSDNGVTDDDRYQVLDKDEVAKECPAFA